MSEIVSKDRTVMYVVMIGTARDEPGQRDSVKAWRCATSLDGAIQIADDMWDDHFTARFSKKEPLNIDNRTSKKTPDRVYALYNPEILGSDGKVVQAKGKQQISVERVWCDGDMLEIFPARNYKPK